MDPIDDDSPRPDCNAGRGDAMPRRCDPAGRKMGAYGLALAYAQQRLQFGKPIASFQMMQDLVAKMLGNVTACQCLMLRCWRREGRATRPSLTLPSPFRSDSRPIPNW